MIMGGAISRHPYLIMRLGKVFELRLQRTRAIRATVVKQDQDGEDGHLSNNLATRSWGTEETNRANASACFDTICQTIHTRIRRLFQINQINMCK